MVRHIVLFKIKEGTPPAESENLASLLAALKEKTGNLIVEAHVAKDIVHAANSYDIVLNSKFKNLEDLKSYQIHPDHVKVLDIIRRICVSTVKIDYQE